MKTSSSIQLGQAVTPGVALLILLIPSVAGATTYRVGPKQAHATLQAVAGKLNPGDIVEVQGGATYGSVLFERHGDAGKPITIRGITVGAKRPIIRGGRDTIEAAGNHYVFENVEITGGSFRCFFHRAHDITLRNVVVHDCPAHGILGADEGSGSMLLESSEIYRCGGGEKHHPVYMATDERAHPGSVFRMQYCYVHDGNGGNNVKSRAERNEIYYNWIEGARYHELELIGPDGADPALKREDSEVIGNVFRKLNDAYTIRVGGDGTGETNGRYRFVHNTFLLEAENRPVFRLFDGIESIEMHNNVLYAIGGGPVRVTQTENVKWSTGREVLNGTNNWLPKGSKKIPSSWSGTVFGSDPMFENFSEFDLRPSGASPLRNAGAVLASTSSPQGFSFPNPRMDVAFQPPRRGLGPRVLKRGSDGKPDIGAYEGGFEFSAMDPPSKPMSLPSAAPTGSVLGPSRPGAGGGRCGCDLPGRSSRNAAPWVIALVTWVGISWRRRRSGC